MQILIVDDDAVTRAVIRAAAEHSGHTVCDVSDGAEALRELEAHAFDVILCDIRMPHMDGVAFFRQLRMDKPEMARRVVFLSTFAEETPVSRFVRETEQPLLGKPFEWKAFVRALRDLPDVPGEPT